MVAQFKDLTQPATNALTWMEDTNRRVWGDKITLATFAHSLGGLGLGLLGYKMISDRSRPTVGYVLVGLSALLHGYAMFTMWPGVLRSAGRERQFFRR